MLSKECRDCDQIEACTNRYKKATKGDIIYCPNGTSSILVEVLTELREMAIVSE